MRRILKFLYGAVPFKKHIFYFVRYFWTPPESIYRHLHFSGVINVSIDHEHSFKIMHYGYQIENDVFWAGLTAGWEKVSMMLWVRLCSDAKVIIDVGANTGIYSLVARSLNKEARIYAFEPVNRVFRKLENNVRLNNYHIVTIEKALSDSEGSAVIYDLPAEHIYSVTVNKQMAGPDAPVIKTPIETTTLDAFVETYAIENVDLIKIDVETHEPQVLQGFSKFLGKMRPTMLIEILNDEVAASVENMVRGLGYNYYNIDEHGSIRKVDRITKSDYYNYLLCSDATAERIGIKDLTASSLF